MEKTYKSTSRENRPDILYSEKFEGKWSILILIENRIKETHSDIRIISPLSQKHAISMHKRLRS